MANKQFIIGSTLEEECSNLGMEEPNIADPTVYEVWAVLHKKVPNVHPSFGITPTF